MVPEAPLEETDAGLVATRDGWFVLNAREARWRHADGTLEGAPDWGAYTVDPTALRHGASIEEETTDADQADARFPELEPTPYREGWPPGR